MASLHSAPSFRFAQLPVAVIGSSDLTPGEKIVYSALSSYRNARSGRAWPSRATLAALTGFHPDYISRATSKLVDLGYLERHADGRGRGRVTVFTFPIKPDRAISEPASTPLKGTDDIHAPPVDNVYPIIPEAEASRGVDLEEIQEQAPESPPEPRKLVMPKDVPPDLIPALISALAGLDWDVRQMLLDELAGWMESGKVRRPPGYLRWLVGQYRRGKLICEHARRIQRQRQRREENRRAIANAMAMRPPETPVAARLSQTDVTARFDALRAATGLRRH